MILRCIAEMLEPLKEYWVTHEDIHKEYHDDFQEWLIDLALWQLDIVKKKEIEG